ncbi:hypothetical protein Tco_1334144 [Tanacetum coccineum]
MSSITVQQTKLDLELVSKENRLDIGKCNGRIPCGLTPREPTFQVVLDVIALTPCYPTFLITANVPEICPRAPGGDFDPLPSEEDIVSFLRELSHTGEINSLNNTSGLDKLRLSRAQILWGVVPPKMARKFKKASPSKKDSDLVLVDEEPVIKGKRVKRPAKKSTTKPVASVAIKEAPVETKSKSKEKEKVDVTHRKGIKLLSEVALTEEAQMKENKSEEQVSDSEQEEESKDDDQEEDEFVHTPSPTDDKDDENLESKSDEVIKSDEEKGLDDTTYQFDDDVDTRLKESTQTDKEVIQGEGADDEMHDAQQGNGNLKTTQEQVVEDAHLTISSVTKKTEVPVTSSSVHTTWPLNS